LRRARNHSQGVVSMAAPMISSWTRATQAGLPCRFHFAKEDGTQFSGWNPGGQPFAMGATSRLPSIDGSRSGQLRQMLPGRRGEWRGLQGHDCRRRQRKAVSLYVTQFSTTRVEVYDTTFQARNASMKMLSKQRGSAPAAPSTSKTFGGTLLALSKGKDAPEARPVGGAGLV